MNGRLKSSADRQVPLRPTAAVSAIGLEKSYGDVTVLGPLDLTIERGESVVLAGHNGSGKSTLLGVVAGTIESSEGRVSVFGRAPGSLASRAAVSYLPDTPVLYDDLSVVEHLDHIARLHGRHDPERVDELIDRLGLRHRCEDLPSRFSRGLRQRTALAVGLVRPFDLLLVDEPFVGLDRSGREALTALIDEARERGATVVVATHEPTLLQTFDRCVGLHDGDLVFDGPPGDYSA